MDPLTLPDLLLFALGITILAWPGFYFLTMLNPGLPTGERAVLGTVLAFALHIVFLNYVPLFHLKYHVFVCAVLFFLAFAFWLKKPLSRENDPKREGLFLVLLLFLQFVLLLTPCLRNPLPWGNDAVYHVAISEKLLREGILPKDFFPYDPVAPTYTLGSHWLTAFLSDLTALPIHRLYQLLMILFLLLGTGVIFCLGQVFFGPLVGLFSAFSFAFITHWGSLDLLRWGSLPNLAGMIFFLAAVRLLFFSEKKVTLFLSSLCLAAMISTHHLSALIFVLVSLVLGLRRYPLFPRIAKSVGLAVLLIFPSIFLLTKEIFRSILSEQRAALDPGLPYLNVWEPMILPWQIPILLGPILCILAGIGLCQIWQNSSKDLPKDLSKNFLWLWFMTLSGAFVILDWPVRFFIRQVWQTDLAVLTPSRFLTDLAYPLCILSGLGIFYLWKNFRKICWTLLVISPLYAVWILSPLWQPQFSPEMLEGLLWFSKNSPKESLLLQAPTWTPYVSGREGDWMVLREETLSPYTERKRNLLKQGTSGVEAWMSETKRPVYLWEEKNHNFRNLEAIWHEGKFYLYRFMPQ